MNELKDPQRSELIKVDQSLEIKKALYRKWRDIVASGLDTWYERARCIQESRDFENVLVQKKEERNGLQMEMGCAQKNVESLQIEFETLSNLLNEAIRFRYISERIKDRQFQITQAKNRFFSHDNDGRDLKQVEADYLDLMQNKDRLTEENTKLNKQVTILNNQISAATSAASESEKVAREKEALYKQTQEAAGRKNVLEERSFALAEQEKKVSLYFACLEIEGIDFSNALLNTLLPARFKKRMLP